MRPHGLIALGLVAGTAAVFLQVRGHEFVNFDDYVYVVENANLREELDAAGVVRAFTQPYHMNWTPLTAISYQVDYRLHGVEPAGYLLTNVMLHALAVVLLFWALTRMTDQVWPSAWVAAVFAVHPLHVESVAWASARKDVLSGLFAAATLLAYARYAERPSPGRYLPAFLLLALGLLSKSTLIVLPFLLLLLDYWPLRRLGAASERGLPDRSAFLRAVAEKLPMLAIAAVAGLLTLVAQRTAGGVASVEAVPLAARLANAVDSLVLYLRDAVWPSGLCIFYPHPLDTLSAGRVVLAVAILVGVTFAALRSARSRPYAIVGWLWYLGGLLPVIGIVQVGMQARADRYMYLPLIGLTIVVAWGGASWAGASRARRRAAAGVGAGIALGLGLAAHAQVATWSTTVTLFERAVAATEANATAQHGLAGGLALAGRHAEAERHYLEAARLDSDWADPIVGAGEARVALGDPEGAMLAYRRALEISPDHFQAHALMGHALADAGRYDEAARHYRRSLERPRHTGLAETQALLAQALEQAGDLDAALHHYREALAVRPDYAQAHAALASTHLKRGEVDPAERHLREALRLEPDLASASRQLAWILATCLEAQPEDPEEALRWARVAVSAVRQPGPLLLDTLAAGEASVGRFDDAAATAERAAQAAEHRGDHRLAAAIRSRGASYHSGSSPRKSCVAPASTGPSGRGAGSSAPVAPRASRAAPPP